MYKDIENMSERELLKELVLQGRRAERANRITIAVISALLLLVLFLALVYIPKIMAPIRQLEGSMDQIRRTLDEAEQFFGSIGPDTVNKFEEALDGLNETSLQAREFMNRLKDSGIENVMGTLDELTGTLKNFLRIFGRS
jgi:ABC-type transporter Mla subunit MlaD